MNTLVQKRNYPRKDKIQVIYELRHKFRISELVKVAGIPRNTYYYCTKVHEKPDKYADVKNRIKKIFDENKKRVGYRRITIELHGQEIRINHKTVQRLMKELGLFGKVRMKKYKSYKGEVGKVAPNLLARDFKAGKPNEKWLTDITEFSLFGQNYIYLQS